MDTVAVNVDHPMASAKAGAEADWSIDNDICIVSFRQSRYVKVIEGSLEVKLPTIWIDEKAEVGRVKEEKRRRKKIREEKEAEDRRCRSVRENVAQSRNSVFFQ